MRSDVQKELIRTQMEVILEAVKAGEKSYRDLMKRAGRETIVKGVDLRHIQYELVNIDNSVTLTILGDTIVRDRLTRLVTNSKLFRQKLGREVVYTTPETQKAIDAWREKLEKVKSDREDRLAQLSADLGYPVHWFTQTGYYNRKDLVTILIEDLEAIAQKI